MKKYYTISGKTDGFGAQYQAIMSGIAFCEYKNYTYLHTPFTKMEHGVDINKMNDFIGINGDNIEEDTIIEKFSRVVHFSKNPSIYYTPAVIKKIRDFYYKNPKPVIENIDIAIHIRRGDVSQVINKNRYTSNDTYNKIIEKLKVKYPDYNILIFSQGTHADFNDLHISKDNLRLNLDILVTFHSLVSAKVLVMSKSSFAYSAGILNKNTVYYEQFLHNKLDHFIPIIY